MLVLVAWCWHASVKGVQLLNLSRYLHLHFSAEPCNVLSLIFSRADIVEENSNRSSNALGIENTQGSGQNRKWPEIPDYLCFPSFQFIRMLIDRSMCMAAALLEWFKVIHNSSILPNYVKIQLMRSIIGIFHNFSIQYIGKRQKVFYEQLMQANKVHSILMLMCPRIGNFHNFPIQYRGNKYFMKSLAKIAKFYQHSC